MRICIRKSCFETNSSSSHSIVRMKKSEVGNVNNTEAPYVGDDGLLLIFESSLEFERSPFKILYTPYEKWRYALASAASSCGGRVFEKNSLGYYEDVLKKIYPNIKYIEYPESDQYHYKKDAELYPELYKKDYESYLEGEKKTLKELLEVDKDYFYVCEKYFGYVDHQSEGLLNRFLQDSGISLDEFLVDSRYLVIIDGDEYQVWDYMKKNGVISKRDIDKEWSSL